MFKFRFDSIVRLRENERDAARASLAEAYEAMRQIEIRRKELTDARAALDQESLLRRSGRLSVDRLLSDGRYERQLTAELAQISMTAEKVEAELIRRQTVLTEANAAVRQMELLKERELAAYTLAQEKISQANLDEIAGRGHRRKNLMTVGSPPAASDDVQETRS
ncbi:MAG: flagellar export protein FliJ [Planctomycetaceae bacterium]